MTLDKSKKVGRFRRRDRGVSHVFAIFFPNLLYAISFVIYSYLIYRPLPLLSDNQRTNEQRTRERKGSRLSLLFERHTEEEDEAPPIYRRRLTIRLGFDTVEWPSSNSKPNPSSSPPTLLSLASLFSRTDSEIRRCPYNYYYGRGGNTESLAFVFVTRDSVAKVYKGKNIFDYCYFFFRFFLLSIDIDARYKYDEKLYRDVNTIKRQFD